EAHAMLAAMAAMQGGAGAASPEPRTRHVALGPTLGQCCGGAVTLTHAALDAAALAQWPAPAPRFVLQLYGAGHVGSAIARGLPASGIARLTCPIGIAGIEGKEPEVIAAAVVAQLLLASSVGGGAQRHAGCHSAVPFAEHDDGCEEVPSPLVEARHRDE